MLLLVVIVLKTLQMELIILVLVITHFPLVMDSKIRIGVNTGLVMNVSTSTNAIYNTFLGSGSGYKNTTGYRNTFLGAGTSLGFKLWHNNILRKCFNRL